MKNLSINALDPTGRSCYLLPMPTGKPKSSKRDELVDIASDLFYEQGYGATGIKQIIDTAGIAKGTFYSHFSSKEELGIAWLKKRHIVWNAWLTEQVDQARSPKGRILSLFDFLESWMTKSEFRGCAFINTLAEVPNYDSPMRLEISEHKKELRETIQDLAVECFTDKTSAFGKQKGTTIFLLFEGALVESQNFRDTWPIASARKAVNGILVDE